MKIMNVDLSSGRLNRKGFVKRLLILLLLVLTPIGAIWSLGVLGLKDLDTLPSTLTYIFVIGGWCYVIACIIYYFLLTTRRLHDLGHSGKWVWLLPGSYLVTFASILLTMLPIANAFPRIFYVVGFNFVGVFNIIALLYLVIKKGESKSNKFGPQPK